MDNIELARFYDDEKEELVTVTVSGYNKLIESKDRNGISCFLYHRLYSRYLKPFIFGSRDYKDKYKNGFSMMANFCLLVETIQSFKNGWGDSHKKSELAFKQFFNNNSNFIELNQKGSIIYKNIRCGILHQGETAGGWKITREGKVLFDNSTNTIDAVLFAERLEKSLKDYSENLKTSEWDSELWDNFRTKMRKVVKNCESKS